MGTHIYDYISPATDIWLVKSVYYGLKISALTIIEQYVSFHWNSTYSYYS